MNGSHGLTRPVPPTCTDKLLWDVWMSAYHFPALTVADEMGLFVLLDESYLTAGEVAARLSINHRGAEALLGLLSSLGFVEQYDGRFVLSEVARNYLLPKGYYYWGPMLRLYQDPPMGHKALLEALVRDRRPDRERSTEEWAAGEMTRERAKELTAGMHSHSLPAATGVARVGDFGGVQNLLDLGGGSGCFCIMLAHTYPRMRFTVLELPAVSEFTMSYVSEAGFEDRINVVSADMFKDPWPTGHDALLLSNILHDWDDDRCLWLGQRCFETLPPGGLLYVHTMLLEDTKDDPLGTVGFSMNMVVRTEGKQFSARNLKKLLSTSGFSELSIMPTFGYFSLIKARKPPDN